MAENIIPVSAMAWKVLGAEKVYALPRPNIIIPQTDPAIVSLHVNEPFREEAFRELEILGRFLNGNIVADNFGNRHGERRKWRNRMTKKMSNKVGEDIFHLLYENNNHFRLNVLSRVISATFNLSEIVADEEAAIKIQEICKIIENIFFDGYDPLLQRYDGRFYHQREMKEKLAIIQVVETCCLDVLSFFSDSPVELTPSL